MTLTIEELVRKTHPKLLELGGIAPYLDTAEYCGNSLAVLHQTYRNSLPTTLVDKTTLGQIELEEFFSAVNHTETMVGAATLLTSLSQPLISLELIHAKQESLKEIDADDKLRQKLEDFVQEYTKNVRAKGLGRFFDRIRYADRGGEEALFFFLDKRMWGSEQYREFRSMKKGGRTVKEAAKLLPKGETSYLSSLVQEVRSWKGTTADMMNSASYRSFSKALVGREAKFYTPKLPFRPTYATPILWGPTLLGAGLYGSSIATDPQFLPVLAQLQLFWGFGFGKAKTKSDSEFIRKLAEKAKKDRKFNQVMSSIGRIDELLSFHKYSKEVAYDTCLPTIEEKENHYFVAENLRNPVLVKTLDGKVVGDTVDLVDKYVTVLTGPNSVGKTTLCKSVIQNQILGQAGGYVTASKAKMSIADYLAYQYYAPDKLDEEHGDFGVNMARTKEIFEYTTPKSLVVLNTLASGTTFEEELEHSDNVLRGFNTIGNNTLLVTHNHALADKLQSQGIGQHLMGEYKNGSYTRKFIPGISRNSGSHIVAEKIGFTRANIEAHLRKQGYLKD